jgi:hypothetical protein
MSKYDHLWKYVQRKNEAECSLTFDEIKQILGFPIDHSFLNFKRELSAYGYAVKKIYLKEKRVVFIKSLSDTSS